MLQAYSIQVEEGLDRKRSKASRDLEVRDEQGRQRLHGAFRGGFSAGYYNTVGSKVRWLCGNQSLIRPESQCMLSIEA